MRSKPSIERTSRRPLRALWPPLMSNVRPCLMPRRRISSSQSAALILVALGMASCGGSDDSQPLVGPCVVNYLEPSLIISSVQNSVSAAPVPIVSLSAITVDGQPFNASFLPGNFNVRSVGNTLECTVPCGFSIQEAALSFTVSAPGYTARTVAASGAYSIHGGNEAGCPLELSGGNRIAVSLTPSP
jgi:hypothetical protein